MSLWLLKFRISLAAVAKVLKRPRYSLLALVISVIVLGILLWLFNFELLLYVITNSAIGWVEKITFFVQSYASLVTNFNNMAAVILILFAVLLGINLSLLVFVIRSTGAALGRESGKSGLSLFAAVIGAGCAACGTSILAPFLTAVGSAATIGLVEGIGLVANVLGIGLVVYSIHTLGSIAATALAKN